MRDGMLEAISSSNTMFTIDDARRIADDQPDVVELLRQFEEVNRYYAEAVAAMSGRDAETHAVLNSAGVTLCFEADAYTERFHNDG